MNIQDLVLIDGVRTPMAEFNGPFADLSAIELGARAAKALFERTGVDPAAIDHTVVGNALQTSVDAIYGARHVALKAGVPKEVPALTVNRLCGSGIQAIVSGSHMILAGEARACLVGGMENMTQAPHIVRGARKGLRLGNAKLDDLLWESLMDPYCGFFMAQTSNNLARDYGITREEQDAFAVSSQDKAVAAMVAGRLGEEIVAVTVGEERKLRVAHHRKCIAGAHEAGIWPVLGVGPETVVAEILFKLDDHRLIDRQRFIRMQHGRQSEAYPLLAGKFARPVDGQISHHRHALVLDQAVAQVARFVGMGQDQWP